MSGKEAKILWPEDAEYNEALYGTIIQRWGVPGDRWKYTEVLITVMPQAFAVIAQSFAPDIFRAYSDELLRLPKELVPDANPVRVWFAQPGHLHVPPQSVPDEKFRLPYWYGLIEAQREGNGSRLFVGVVDSYLSEQEALWQLLYAELERRGLIVSEMEGGAADSGDDSTKPRKRKSGDGHFAHIPEKRSAFDKAYKTYEQPVAPIAVDYPTEHPDRAKKKNEVCRLILNGHTLREVADKNTFAIPYSTVRLYRDELIAEGRLPEEIKTKRKKHKPDSI